MGIRDGAILDTTKILDNGPNNRRLNIVLVAEGFQSTEQSAFNTICDEFIAALQAEAWYSAAGSAINVHRLNVSSTDSGTDDPATCGDDSTGSGTMMNTYFDASYCNSGIRRCLQGDNNLLRDTLDDQLPEWQTAAVLVNSMQRGGCASGNVSWTALSDGWRSIVIHELGHAAFGLADEYDSWQGCNSGETNRDNAPTGEPVEPNVTTEIDRSQLKWRHLVNSEIPIPTMRNPDCTQCDTRPNVLSNNFTIGLFEGAQYFHCGRYRPAYQCKMRNSTQPFCQVCVEAIVDNLSNYITIEDDASFVSQRVPRSMKPLVAETAVITMANSGITSWKAGYKLISLFSGWTVASQPIGRSVAPGEEITIEVQLTAVSPGDFTSQWRMSKQFGNQPFGEATPRIEVRVEADSPDENECDDIRAAIERAKRNLRSLQELLAEAPGPQKAGIVAQIRRVQAEIASLEAQADRKGCRI